MNVSFVTEEFPFLLHYGYQWGSFIAWIGDVVLAWNGWIDKNTLRLGGSSAVEHSAS